MNVKQIHTPTSEQVFNINRWHAVTRMAMDAGFDDDAFAYTEFCLMLFFEAIIEECAKQAELQADIHTGENTEAAGCNRTANAIRAFGKQIGNF